LLRTVFLAALLSWIF